MWQNFCESKVVLRKHAMLLLMLYISCHKRPFQYRKSVQKKRPFTTGLSQNTLHCILQKCWHKQSPTSVNAAFSSAHKVSNKVHSLSQHTHRCSDGKYRTHLVCVIKAVIHETCNEGSFPNWKKKETFSLYCNRLYAMNKCTKRSSFKAPDTHMYTIKHTEHWLQYYQNP